MGYSAWPELFTQKVLEGRSCERLGGTYHFSAINILLTGRCQAGILYFAQLGHQSAHWKLWGNSSCFPCSQFVDGVESCQHCKGREGQSFDYSTDSKIKDRSRRVFLLERTFFCLACELPIIVSPFILMCFCVGFFGFY